MTWVGRGVCGAALLPAATQGNVEAGTWPARPFIYTRQDTGASRGAGSGTVEVGLALHPAALPVFSFVLSIYGYAPYTTPRGKGGKVSTCWPSAG